MRRDMGPDVDITNMGALLEIDDAKKMTWIGIAAVDTVAEDRHISEVGIRHHEQFVNRAGKIFQRDLCLIGNWIEKQNFFLPILSTAIIPRELFVSAIVFPRCR